MTASNFLCKRVVMPAIVRRMIEISRTHVHFLRNVESFWVRSFSSPKQHSFTESYLMKSCGLSAETALSASQKVQIQSSERADSVLAVLRDYGCTNVHISRMVIRYPRLLTADPEKTILPKLEFFRSVGFSEPDIATIVVSNPTILRRSLENHVIPCYNFLKSVVMVNEDILRSFRKTFLISSQNVQSNTAPNIQTLKEIGVPMSNIKYLVTCHPTVVSHGKERFSRNVKKVLDMGFDPLRVGFLKAMFVSCQFSESVFQHKMEVYRGFGFTDDDIMLMFRLDPYCMAKSEKKIKSVMKFLVNEMGQEPADIARYPTVFCRSLEKNIIPRCSVLKVLKIKGLVKEHKSLTSLCSSEKIFLDKYVLKYEQEIPGLLNLYQGKIHILELDFVSEWVRQKKQL